MLFVFQKRLRQSRCHFARFSYDNIAVCRDYFARRYRYAVGETAGYLVTRFGDIIVIEICQMSSWKEQFCKISDKTSITTRGQNITDVLTFSGFYITVSKFCNGNVNRRSLCCDFLSFGDRYGVVSTRGSAFPLQQSSHCRNHRSQGR